MKKNSKTRERITGDDKIYSPNLFNRHLASYIFSLAYINKKKSVLDLGCSDGYGSFFIAEKTKKTIGVDNNENAITEAQKKYNSPELTFMVGDALSLLWENEFDLVVSFQVVEHIQDVNLYFQNVKKVLKKNGIFILSTPNRLLRLNKGQKPWNKYHVHEYEKKELKKILKRYFSKLTIFGLQAETEIYKKEIKRLSLRRLIARFDLFNLYEKLPRNLADSFLNKKERKYNINPDNFWVSKDKINSSLDLIAVCRL